MACDVEWGLCPQSSSLAVKFTVTVVLRPPAFREVGVIMPLFAAPGVPLSPPDYSVPALEEKLTSPLAMVNCPMRKIPFAFSVAGNLRHSVQARCSVFESSDSVSPSFLTMG